MHGGCSEGNSEGNHQDNPSFARQHVLTIVVAVNRGEDVRGRPSRTNSRCIRRITLITYFDHVLVTTNPHDVVWSSQFGNKDEDDDHTDYTICGVLLLPS
jgi:hypothetical protein